MLFYEETRLAVHFRSDHQRSGSPECLWSLVHRTTLRETDGGSKGQLSPCLWRPGSRGGSQLGPGEHAWAKAKAAGGEPWLRGHSASDAPDKRLESHYDRERAVPGNQGLLDSLPNAEGSQAEVGAQGNHVWPRKVPWPHLQLRQVPWEQGEGRATSLHTHQHVRGGGAKTQPANQPILVTICCGEPGHLSETAADGRS